MSGQETVSIRLVEPADHERIGEITVAAYGPFLVGADDPYRATLSDTAARAEAADVWVAEDDGELLGSVTDAPPGSRFRELAGDDEGEFRMLAVSPGAQGRGVGRLLAEHVVERARSAGRRAVLLSSLPEMTAAHRLYGRLGFVRAPDLDWSPLPGVELVAFRLEL